MKQTLFFLIVHFSFLHFSSQAGAFECQKVASIGKSERWDCDVQTRNGKTKTFYLLKLREDFAHSAYAHGYLMAEEIQNGVLDEIKRRITDDLKTGSLVAQKLKNEMFSCFLSRMKRSVDPEFRRAVHLFSLGYSQKMTRLGKKSEHTEEDFLMATLATDLSIAAEGIGKKMGDDPLRAIRELIGDCGLRISADIAAEAIEVISKIGKTIKFGCLGFVVPSSSTRDGALIHGRNLDADLVETWNKYPTLFLVDEPGHIKYVGAGTAGILYTGGVTAMNEYGITSTLHEMSSTQYETKFPDRKGITAPYLQTRIAREAQSLDEAIEIIKDAKHFGAWTAFISDARTNEVASVEFSAKRMEVARRLQNQSMGQTNHFLGKTMQDQGFTYNFNKLLESQSRLAVINESILSDKGSIDVDWAIEHLAGHEDSYEGFRSFGRTATKAYTVMSTIAIPSRNEFWLSLGDRHPASHSEFLGFEIDFETLTAYPIDQKRVHLYDDIPHWENSLQSYSDAKLAVDHKYPSQAIFHLTKAISQAKRDGIDELPYYFMRARVFHSLKLYDKAAKDWEFLWEQRINLHPYGQALIAAYSVATTDEIHRNKKTDRLAWKKERKDRLEFSETVIHWLYEKTKHFDLSKKLKVIRDLKKSKKVSLPKMDFVTVE